MDYRIVENYFINRLVGEEGRRFSLREKLPRGVASKSPKQVLDFCSAPTAFEPYGFCVPLATLQKNKISLEAYFLFLVGEEGLEPSLYCYNQILSLARLPVPPLALSDYFNTFWVFML